MAPYLVRGCPGVWVSTCDISGGGKRKSDCKKRQKVWLLLQGGVVFRPIVWKISGLYTGVKRVVAGCAVSCVVIILICIFLCESRSITIFSVFSVCTY